MNNTIKKMIINNKIYDVITPIEFVNTNKLYDMSSTAVERDGLVYPVVGNSKVPGLYAKKGACFAYYNDPKPEELDMYSSDNIIDLSSRNMTEVIRNSEILRDVENEILSNPDNIFEPKVFEKDDSLLRGLKEAITAKQIDFDKYETRIGRTFPNDKRLFGSNYDSITLKKYKALTDALDLKTTIIIEDKSEDVANPMGRVITIDLSGCGEDEE